MKIYIENSSSIDTGNILPNCSTVNEFINNPSTNENNSLSNDGNSDQSFRNIANIFDVPAILQELEEYDIEAYVLPKRKITDDIYAMFIEVPQVLSNLDLVNDSKKSQALVALYVDYSDNTALAMGRKGSNKQTLLLASSIANKHINEPFKYNKNIRSRI